MKRYSRLGDSKLGSSSFHRAQPDDGRECSELRRGHEPKLLAELDNFAGRPHSRVSRPCVRSAGRHVLIVQRLISAVEADDVDHFDINNGEQLPTHHRVA